MAQPEQPPRSLRRDGGGPRYYRDWSAVDDVIARDSYLPEAEDPAAELPDAPAEMHMVEGFDEAPAPRQELAPLNVIVPEAPPPSAPAAPAKPTITRIDRSKIQRARRYDELKAEEEAQAAEAAAQREEQARQMPDRSAKTRALTPSHSHRTTELQTNIKEIGGKIDETKENVKSTANALSQNLRQFSENLTQQMVGGIQRLGKGLNSWIGRFGKPLNTSGRAEDDEDFDDEDFDDEPLPVAQAEAQAQAAVTSSRPEPKAQAAAKAAAPQHPLEDIPYVPPVMYADLLKEKVLFQTFDKQELVLEPEQLEPETLQQRFVDNALQDIRKCIKLVRDLPDPTEGPYAGIPLATVFRHVRDQDLFFFMHYVLSKPDPFRKKTFKISEAFATWILKRSHSTVVSEPFPEIPAIAYYPLYKDNVRFQTLERKQLVLATGKSPEEVDGLFLQRAQEDVRKCVKMVEKFPPAQAGPYKGKPLRQIFRYVKPRDIYFFLHYVKAQPDVFRGQNFKFAEAFASWILKRSHETKLPD